MNRLNCPDCGELQFSICDTNYTFLFNTCWECDKKRWKKGELSLEEFERRENQSVKIKFIR